MGGGNVLGLKVEKDCQFTLVAPLAEECLRHTGASGKGCEVRGNTAPTAAHEWTVRNEPPKGE